MSLCVLDTSNSNNLENQVSLVLFYVGNTWCWWHPTGGQAWCKDGQGHCPVCATERVYNSGSRFFISKTYLKLTYLAFHSFYAQARETLAEIPGQFLSYMKSKGIKPNPPVSRPPPQLGGQSQAPYPPPSGTTPYPQPPYPTTAEGPPPYPTQQQPPYPASYPTGSYPQSTVQ